MTRPNVHSETTGRQGRLSVFVAGDTAISSIVTKKNKSNNSISKFHLEDRMNRFDSTYSLQRGGRVPLSLRTLLASLALVAAMFGLDVRAIAQPSLSATLSPSPSTVCAPQNVTYTWTITNPPQSVTYGGAGVGLVDAAGLGGAVTYAPNRAGNNYNDILAAANPGNNNDDFVYLVNDADLTLTGNAGGGDFNFRFFGTTYNLSDNGFYIGANGFIRFRDSYTTAAQVTGNVNAGAFNLLAAGAPWNTIAALSTDLAPQGQGNVAGEDLVGWEIVDDNGAAAGASLVISWYDVSQFNPALAYPFNRVRVQLILRSDNHATQPNQFIVEVEELPDPAVVGRTFTIGAENSCQVAKAFGDESVVGRYQNAVPAWVNLNQAAWNAGIENNSWTFAPTSTGNQQYSWTITDGTGVLATGVSSNTTDSWTFPTSYAGAYTYPPTAETNSHYVEIVWNNLNDNCERTESPLTSYTVKPNPPANPIRINGVFQATGYDICNNTSYALSLTQDNSGSSHTYAWTLTSATAGVTYTFSNATGASTNLTVVMPAGGGDPISVNVSCAETNPLGCVTTNTISYDVHQIPGAVTITQTAGGSICATSGGPYTFAATTAAVTPSVTTPTYVWDCIALPALSTVTFSAPTSATTNVSFSGFPTTGQPQNVTLRCVVQNAASGCTSTGTLAITVNTTVPVNSVTASATWYCGQTTVVFSLPPVAGATYTWEVIGNPDLAVPNTTSATRNGAVITTGASTTFVAGDTVHITFTDPTSTTNNRTTWIVDAVVTPAGNCGPVNQTHATTYQIYNPTTAAAPAFPSTSGARRVTAAPTYDIVDAAGALCLRNTGSENYAVFDIDVPTPMGDPDRVFFQWDGTDGIVDEILFANAAGTVLHTFSNPAENTDLSNDPNTVVVAGTYKLFVHFTGTGNFRIRSGQEQNYLTPLWCQTLSPWSSSVTINALPAAPVVATTGYCVAATLDSVTTNTPAAGVTHTINSITGAAAITSNAPQTSAAGQPAIVEVTNWGGNATATVVATALNTTTNCSRTSTTVITIGALPVANIASGDATACAYPTDPTGVAGNTIDLAYAKDYTAGSSAAGDIFSWSLTNGYIAQYSTDGGGTWTTVGTVGQTLGYTVDATMIKAVFFGASPGDVKYTRLVPSSNCLTTSTPRNVTFVTPAAITLSGATNFCATSTGNFALTTNTSTVGINYQLEVSTNGGAFTPVTPVAVVAGSGAALTFTENNSAYPAGAGTINTYQFRVMGYNGSVAACDYGPSNSVTVRVTPQPADIPVSVTTSGCTGGTATVSIGSGASPSQSFVNYTVQVRPAGAGTWTTLGTIPGNGTGAATYTHTPLPAGAVPTATTPNYEYRVSALTTATTYSTCTTPLTQQPTIMIFANPTNPTVTTSTGSAYCWNTSGTNLVTLNLATTQVGVTYNVKSSTSGATTLATIVGDGSPMSASVAVNAIQASNPGAPVTSQITVEASITNGTYPSTTCMTSFNGPSITINPRPNDLLPVSLSPIRVCESSNLTVTVTGVEANTTYNLFVTDAPTPTSWTLASNTPVISGGVATFTVAAPTIATPNPLQSTPNFQYKVVATYNATACAVDLQTQPDVTVFDTPVNPSASVTSNPTCWTSGGTVTVRLASTQNGVRYNIKNGGAQIATVLPGAGSNIDVNIPLTTIIASNPASGSQAVTITVDAQLVQEGAFTRPVPTTGCLTNYAVTNGNFTVFSTPTDKSFTTTTSVCSGGTVTTAVASTDTWTEYRLVRSTTAGGTYTAVGAGTYTAGNGGTLNLTDVPTGTGVNLTAPSYFYRVEARNGSSASCAATMTGTTNTYAYSAISNAVGVSVAPSALCATPGTGNFTVTLTSTQAGVTYTVKNPGGSSIGTIEGNGGTATGTFAQSTLAGGSAVTGGTSFTLSVDGVLSSATPYNARPIPAGGCLVTMTATPSIVVNTFPSTVTVTANSTLCLPGNLTITLGNTNAFVNYTIDRTTNGGTTWTTVVNNAPYTGAITDASLTGGDPVNGLAWTYRVTAVNGACTNVQNNVHTVTVYNALNTTFVPTVAGLTGGTSNKVCYENGNTFKVTLSGSQLGVNYTFRIGATAIATVAGTGAAIETAALNITSVGLTVPGVGNGGVTNFTVAVDAARATAPTCAVTMSNSAAGKAVEKLPASTPFTVTPAIGCANDTYTVTIGPVEPYFFVSISTTGLSTQNFSGLASSLTGWNAGTKTATFTTTLNGGGPLTSIPTNAWTASGYHGSEGAVGFCSTLLTSTPTNTVFALPTAVTTSASPSAACWPTGTTVTAANTQDGIVYSLERFNGTTWAPTGLTANGTGGTVTIDVPFTILQAAQLNVPTTVQLRLVGTLRTGAAPYNRPVPVNGCATVVGSTSVLVNPKPEITVVAGQSWNGASTVSTPNVNQSTICAQNQFTAIGPWTYRNYSVSTNTVLNATQPSTYAWTVLTEATGDILDRTGMNTIAPTIAWGIYPAAVAAPNITTETLRVIATTSAGCADTATYNVTINPTLGDAVLTHNLGKEACVYNNWTPARSVFTLGRTATGITGYPAGTTFNWAVTHPRELTNPPTYAIFGVGNTNTLQVEWLQPSTQTGTAADSASVTVTATLPAAWGGCATTRTFNVFVHTTPTPAFLSGPTAVCPNSTHTYAAVQNTNNTYSWEVVGGTIAGGTGAGTATNPSTRNTGTGNSVSVTFGAANTPAQVRLIEINEAGCQSQITRTVTITAPPTPFIRGPIISCLGETEAYDVEQNYLSSYAWSLSPANAGTPVAGWNTSNEIEIRWDLVGTHTLTVVETNDLGCVTTSSRNITVNQTPIQTSITGPATVCNGTTRNYSVTSIANQTYAWTVTGGQIVSGAGTNAVSVQWTATGNQTIDVTITTAGTTCAVDLTQNVTVEDTPAPSITGATPACTGSTQTYTTPAVAGHSYVWSHSSGGVATTGTTGNSYAVNWTTAGTHTVSVTQRNASANCATTATMSVVVNQTPVQTSITGPATVCNGTTRNYSVTSIANQTYAWTVTGGQITSGAGTNAIAVQWTTTGNQTVGVTIATVGTNCSVNLTQNVTVEETPAPSITGATPVCTGSTQTYTTPAVAGHSYVWSHSSGGVATSGTTGNAYSVNWTTAGTHTVTVTQRNASANCVTSATLSVVVNQTPVQTAINGDAIVCQGSSRPYSVAPVAGQSYNWTVTGGSITSGQSTGGIVVNWSTLGNQTVGVTITTDGTNCTRVITRNVAVTYQPAPVIAGVQIACINKTHVYSTPETIGSTYSWTITPSNSFQDIGGFTADNEIEVRWIQPGLHTVSVTETSLGGYCSATATINVRVNPIPTPAITSATGYGNPATRRPGVVCNNSIHTYAVTATPDNVFQWTVAGGTIVAGQNTNTITVQWGATGIGTIACTETVPGSDCITTTVDQVNIRPTPTPQITGEVNPCGNATFDYTTPLVTGNTYTWSAIGGTGVQTAPNTFRVTWTAPVWPNTGTASVTVREDVADVAPAGTCFATTTLNVTIRPIPPVPTITGPTVVCATDLTDSPATVNTASYTSSIPTITGASGSLTPTWSVTGGTIVSGQGTLTLNVQWANNGSTPVTGTVSCLHTSTFGCAATGTLSVTVNPLPNPSIVGASSACQNTVENYSTVGVPGNAYVWSLTGGNIIRSGQGTPNVAVEWTLPGVATITVSETNGFGCTVLNQRQVTVNALPQAQLSVSGPTTFCQGGDVTISAPLGFSNYVWNTGETARSIVVRTTGNYWVVVTDANGCSNRSDTVTVNVFPSALPIVTISGPLTFCEGGSVTLTAPAGFSGYLWSNGATTQTITVTESGSYTVSVSDGNGCTGTSTEVDVTVYAKPTPTITVNGGPFCAGDDAEVTAPAGYVSYTWVSANGTVYTPTNNGRTITLTASDEVSCQVVDVNGCAGVSNTLNVVFSRVQTPVVAVNGPTTFCEGGAVTLTAPEGYTSYVWSNGVVGRTITVDRAGEYFVTVANQTCPAVSAKTTITVNNLPAVPTIQRMGDVLSANSAAATAYQWIRNGVDMPGAANKQLTVNLPGTYRVRVTDANGCENTSEGFDVILTDVNDDVVAGHQAALRVSPNPTNGRFIIETIVSEAGPVRIELVNALGELVMTLNETSVAGNFRATVDMGTLSAGAYNVVVSAGNQRWVARMVRQ